MEQDYYTNSLRDVLNILFKHKYKILTVFTGIVCIVTIVTFLLPPTYEAKSSLMVKFGRENIYRPEVGDEKPVISFQSYNPEELINTEIQIITSRDLIEKVINTLGIETLYPDLIEDPPDDMTILDSAIIQLEEDFSAHNVNKSNVIIVSYQHEDPIIAAKMVNQLVQFAKEKHLQVFSNPKSSFLGKQLDIYQQKLKKSENDLEAFKQKHQVFSLDEQRSLLLKQQTDLDTSLKTTQNRMQELERKVSFLKKQMQIIPENVPLFSETTADRYKIIDEAKGKLLALEIKEQELLRNYRESSRFIVGVRNQMQIVKDFLEKQEKNIKGTVRTGKNVTYEEMEMDLIKASADLNSLDAKRANLVKQLNQLKSEIRVLDLGERELRVLKRELSSGEKNYEIYLNKWEEARISDEMDLQKMANISIIQEAPVPAEPIKPLKLLNISLGVILGAFSGLGLAFFSEYIGQSFSTPEIAERSLGLRILTTVPYIK